MMRKTIFATNIVKDYKIMKPREPRNFESIQQSILDETRFWLTTRGFLEREVIPILSEEITLIDKRSKNPSTHDILFEYLIIRSVTILEIQLKHYCDIFVKKYPERAELLLKNRDKSKDLSLQILSTYSFSSLNDIKHVFSTLLGKDFFQVLRHRSEEHKSSIGYERDHLRRASPLFKKWNMFVQLIKIRNGLVHENKHPRIRNKKVKKDMLNTIYEVNYLTSSELLNLPYNENSFKEIRARY